MNIEATKETMREEILDSIKRGETFDSIRDTSGELIDSHTPLYNPDIIKEWQHMPSSYDNRGAAELGAGQEINIINLMQLDLYLYYSDIFNEVLEEIEEASSDES
jgi:hypothetical protein